MKINDLDELAKWWGKSENNYKTRKENTQAWKVNANEIKDLNYNLDCKNPYIREEEIHDPELLLSQYTKIQKDINSLRGNLKNILSEAFKTTNSED